MRDCGSYNIHDRSFLLNCDTKGIGGNRKTDFWRTTDLTGIQKHKIPEEHAGTIGHNEGHCVTRIVKPTTV